MKSEKMFETPNPNMKSLEVKTDYFEKQGSRTVGENKPKAE